MARTEPYFLKNPQWYKEYLDDSGSVQYKLTEKAPEEAVKSFKEYQKQEEEQVKMWKDKHGDIHIDIVNF